MIINVDLDGVVYPWHETMADWLYVNLAATDSPSHLWEDGHYRSFPEPTQWFFEGNEWGLSDGEFKNWFRLGVKDGYIWKTGTPIEGASKYMWQLSDRGHYIRIVTTRLVHNFGHQMSIDSTTEWLDRWNIPYRSIAFLGIADEKFDYKCDIAVDDNIDNLRDSDILFGRKWSERPFEVRVANNWQEVFGIIDGLSSTDVYSLHRTDIKPTQTDHGSRVPPGSYC